MQRQLYFIGLISIALYYIHIFGHNKINKYWLTFVAHSEEFEQKITNLFSRISLTSTKHKRYIKRKPVKCLVFCRRNAPTGPCQAYTISNSTNDRIILSTLYSRVQKSIENFAFRPKMTIFRRAGMRKGALLLPLAFQYLILMIWRACDLNLVMISSLASK